MDTQDNNNKEVKVILPKQEDEEEKKKRKKRFLLLLIGMIVIVADISGLLAFITIQDAINKRNSSEEQPYVVKEETKTIYNNLLAFFDVAGEGLHPTPNKLVSVTFKDNRLYMVGVNDTNAIVVNRLTEKDNITDALALFSNSVPSIGDSSIESSYTLDPNTEVNLECHEKVGYVYTSLTSQKYIACTYYTVENYIMSLPHQEYSPIGVYTNIDSATPEDNPLVYDLYRYMLA